MHLEVVSELQIHLSQRVLQTLDLNLRVKTLCNRQGVIFTHLAVVSELKAVGVSQRVLDLDGYHRSTLLSCYLTEAQLGGMSKMESSCRSLKVVKVTRLSMGAAQ